MSILSDSGFEDFHSPSPPSTHRLVSRSHVDAEQCPLLADWQLSHYDESCFTIQQHNEKEYLTRDCLTHQPQVGVFSSVYSNVYFIHTECIFECILSIKYQANLTLFFTDIVGKR